MKKINFIQPVTDDVGYQTNGGKRFRLRAAAIIIEKNQVLFAKNEKADYYYTIGGGVRLGESMAEAVKREVLEETGVPYEVERLAFVHENFFKRDEENVIDCHEITLYFLMKERGILKLDSHSTTEGVPEHMCWLPIDKLAEYDVYPKFFIEKLKRLSPYPEHIITRED